MQSVARLDRNEKGHFLPGHGVSRHNAVGKQIELIRRYQDYAVRDFDKVYATHDVPGGRVNVILSNTGIWQGDL